MTSVAGLSQPQVAAATFASITGTFGDNAALSRMFQDVATIDMSNADYTMSDNEAASYAKILTNVGDGTKTLTWPSTSDSLISASQFITTAFAANQVTLASQTGGSSAVIGALRLSEVVILPGVGVFVEGDSYATSSNAVSNGVTVITDAAYSFGVSDCGKLIVGDRGTAQAFTLDSTVDFPTNAKICVMQKGAGTVTITASGTTIIGTAAMVQNQLICLYRDGTTDEWYVG